MIRQIPHLLFIMLLLMVQVGQAFASTVACEGHDKVMMAGHTMNSSIAAQVDHSQHNMPMTESGEVEQSVQDCCQKDCCCPVALVSVGALIDSHIIPSLHLHAVQLFDVNDNMVSVFIALLHRPPINPTLLV